MYTQVFFCYSVDFEEKTAQIEHKMNKKYIRMIPGTRQPR